jgi:SAM-dependent methyltransferase
MKDSVADRKRIGLARKLKLARIALRENGVRWCACLLTYYAASAVAQRAFGAMDRLRRTRHIPGLNSATLNREIWDAWDWGSGGEEWSGSEEWKQSLLRCVLEREIPVNSSVLEIGPGAGRWTTHLLERARDYIGIDISSTCVQHCRDRFSGRQRVRFEVGSGRDLAAVPSDSVDAIWSYDVFVHINRAEVASYAHEFARVLRGGGVGVVHHGSVGGASGGWRSDLTADAFASILAQHELQVRRSFNSWDDGGAIQRLAYDDLITVFSKHPTGGQPRAPL